MFVRKIFNFQTIFLLINLSVNLPKWCLAVKYTTLHWSFDRWEVNAWFFSSIHRLGVAKISQLFNNDLKICKEFRLKKIIWQQNMGAAFCREVNYQVEVDPRDTDEAIRKNCKIFLTFNHFAVFVSETSLEYENIKILPRFHLNICIPNPT